MVSWWRWLVAYDILGAALSPKMARFEIESPLGSQLNKKNNILFLMMFSDRKAHLIKRSENLFVTCFIFRSCQTIKSKRVN